MEAAQQEEGVEAILRPTCVSPIEAIRGHVDRVLRHHPLGLVLRNSTFGHLRRTGRVPESISTKKSAVPKRPSLGPTSRVLCAICRDTPQSMLSGARCRNRRVRSFFTPLNAQKMVSRVCRASQACRPHAMHASRARSRWMPRHCNPDWMATHCLGVTDGRKSNQHRRCSA